MTLDLSDRPVQQKSRAPNVSFPAYTYIVASGYSNLVLTLTKPIKRMREHPLSIVVRAISELPCLGILVTRI